MSDTTPRHAREEVLSVEIAAPPASVWAALTVPAALRAWMADEGAPLDIELEAVLGGRAVFRSHHAGPIEARGVVTALEPERRLAYTHRADISGLPDRPESYATLDFSLARVPGGTRLTLQLGGFATESIEKHLVFYWRTTLEVLRRWVERGAGA